MKFGNLLLFDFSFAFIYIRYLFIVVLHDLFKSFCLDVLFLNGVLKMLISSTNLKKFMN